MAERRKRAGNDWKEGSGAIMDSGDDQSIKVACSFSKMIQDGIEANDSTACHGVTYARMR